MEPTDKEIAKKIVEIDVSTRLEPIGILILFVPYAKLAAQASMQSESTSSIASNIAAP